MKKIYSYKSTRNKPVLDVFKWLREHGSRDTSFVIHRATYNELQVEFIDDQLELMYIMKYDWT